MTEVKKASPSGLSMRNELGTVALKQNAGVIYEESLDALRWPESVHTFKKMSMDASIASANNVIKSMIRNVEWDVVVPQDEDLTQDQKDQAKFIKECMNDMEIPWADFINETLSMLIYGYSIHEKVFKVRNGRTTRVGKYSSKFTDQKLGWAKLPVRSQSSIYKWNFDSNGRNLLSVTQNLALTGGNSVTHSSQAGLRDTSKKLETQIEIPRHKMLLFRHDSQRENPEGNSPLKSCYMSWRYKSNIEEIEAIGISRDLAGLPVIEIPPEYMAENASDDKKALYETFKSIVTSIHMNEQAGLVFPRFIDPETKQNIFDFRLVSVDGGKQFDTDSVIKRYDNQILMTYLADVLKMGQDASGSFALSDNKTNLLAVGIEAILREIISVLNNDLIPQTLQLNGWNIDGVIPEITYNDLEERDLDVLSKAVQRFVSVGAIEVDKELSNALRETLGINAINESSEALDEDFIPSSDSKAGEGMKTAGEGTATSVSGNDTSTSNSDNGNP